MAGKTKSMSQIKQLLLLYQQKKGKKTIATVLGMSKNTVKSYIQKLEVLLTDTTSPTSIAELIKLDNPLLEAKFHAGNPAYKIEEERYRELQKQMPYLLKELSSKRGVTRLLLWEEYKQSHPNGYQYSQFCFHLQQQQIAASPSMVLTHLPGDKLFIDFAGSTLSYVDRQTGEEINCQVFIASLPYSDYSFVMAVPGQTIPDFLYALRKCLEHLGGVPAALVPDNLKSAVVKADRYEPKINVAMADFASHYGTTVIPARAAKPKDKALVENQVKLVYLRVYAKLRNQTFFSLYDLNKAIEEKVKDHNQTRMQQKPYCREERFLAEEKKHLGSLPEQIFELKHYKQLKVAKNNHVYLSDDKHYYSVPYQHIGKKVKVIYTRSMVYIFDESEQIAAHIRNYKQGSYSTTKEHLHSHHRHYADRSPRYYLNKAKARSAIFYEYMSHLFNQNKHPEQLYKTCDGLLSLSRKADKTLFERACQIGLENHIYSYGFIKNCLENKTVLVEPPKRAKPLPKHKNIRGKESFNQLEINFYHPESNHDNLSESN